MIAVIKRKINNKRYEFKVETRYFGIEFSLYEDQEMKVLFQMFEEADKIPETEKDLIVYAEYLLRDLKELVPFLSKYTSR